MSSTPNLQSVNLQTIADGLTAILFSPVILPIAEAVKQPIVQSTIKEGIAISERYQNAVSEIAQAWERTTGSQEQREKYKSQLHATNGRTNTAKNFLNLLSDLNTDVDRMTNGVADLRVILPVGVGLLAVRQLIRQGWKLDDIPWYILAWYAIDIFVKLNAEGESELVNVTSTTFSVNLQEQQNSDSGNTYTG